jgi:hypothetical protein
VIDRPVPLPAVWRVRTPWLPAVLRCRRIYVGPGGEVLRVTDDGHVEEVLPGGHPRPGTAHATAITKAGDR